MCQNKFVNEKHNDELHFLTKSIQTVKDVQQIINCSARISKVDVSKERFNFSDVEKQNNKVFGMISPVEDSLRCRSVDDKNGPEGFATIWVRASRKNKEQQK